MNFSTVGSLILYSLSCLSNTGEISSNILRNLRQFSDMSRGKGYGTILFQQMMSIIRGSRGPKGTYVFCWPSSFERDGENIRNLSQKQRNTHQEHMTFRLQEVKFLQIFSEKFWCRKIHRKFSEDSDEYSMAFAEWAEQDISATLLTRDIPLD